MGEKTVQEAMHEHFAKNCEADQKFLKDSPATYVPGIWIGAKIEMAVACEMADLTAPPKTTAAQIGAKQEQVKGGK